MYIINHVQINGKWKTYYIQSLGNRPLKIWKGYAVGLLVQIHKFRPFLRLWFIPSWQYTLPRGDDSHPAPPTLLWVPPPHSHPHPHFLLASAGFCRWCVREGMWDAGWGTVLFLIYCYRTPVEAAPMCRLLSGGNYFWRWGPPRPPNVAWLSIAQLFKQAIHGTHSFTSFIYQIRRRMICKWASFHGTMGGENMWQGGSIWIQITIQGTHYMINGRSVVKMLRFSVWASWFLETLFSYGGTL